MNRRVAENSFVFAVKTDLDFIMLNIERARSIKILGKKRGEN